MSKKTAGKKVRDILFGVLSFFLSFFLFMLSLGVVGEISLFNKSFWIDQMNSTNYFVDKCDEMTDRLVILGYASGLSKDFCEKIVDPIMITTDTETYLDDFFEGGTGRVDTTAFKQKFISELESYIKEKNAKVDQSNVDYLVKNAESRYKDCVKIPLLTQIAGYFHAVKKYLPYITAGLALLSAVIVLVLTFGNRWRHRIFKYLYFATAADCLALTTVAAYVSINGGLRNINLQSRSLYQMVVLFANNVNIMLWVVAAFFLVSAFLFFFLYRSFYLRLTSD